MKKTRIIFIGILALIVLFMVNNVSANPGTESDPIVTKSYVDEKIRELKEEFSSGEISVSSDSGVSFEVVFLKKDSVIKLNENSLFILRTGSATAIAGEKGGLSNLTDGTNLNTGDEVLKNNLILTPRTDGRGVKVTTDAYIMVSGEYNLETNE